MWNNNVVELFTINNHDMEKINIKLKGYCHDNTLIVIMTIVVKTWVLENQMVELN
jgi:hypothetical protein